METAQVVTNKDIICTYLEDYLDIEKPSSFNLQHHLITNEAKTEFVLIAMGWRDKQFFHHLILHLQIVDEEIWIHQNNTDTPIERHLIEMGIAADVFRVTYLESEEEMKSCEQKTDSTQVAI